MDERDKGLTLAQRILVRATELISIKENWIKGRAFRKVGRDPYANYCSLGALYKAAHEECGIRIAPGPACNLMPGPAALGVEKAYKDACDLMPLPLLNIPEFNDNLKTTHEQVKQMFCSAVKQSLEKNLEKKDG